MNGKNAKDKTHIICDAENCVYNNRSGRKCTAGEVRVGTAHASNSAETICATFVCGDRD